MTNEKVLVTGAPGWLGNRFVEILKKEGKDVRCLVLKGMDTAYLKKLGVELFEGDVTKPETLKNIWRTWSARSGKGPGLSR